MAPATVSTILPCRSAPQPYPTRVPHSILQKCSTRVSHKSVPEHCPTRVSLEECCTRVPQDCLCERVPEECPTRMPQECPTGVPDKSTLQGGSPQVCSTRDFQKCPRRALHDNVKQNCRTSLLQEYCRRVSPKNVCLWRVPRKSAKRCLAFVCVEVCVSIWVRGFYRVVF